MKKNVLLTRQSGETIKRTIVRTVTYRTLIIILDFAALYIMTGKTSIAIGFTIISNIYTTIAYFFHERLWDKIDWGTLPRKKKDAASITQSPL